LPLLIASISSYAFTVWAMRRSILTEKVARRGYDVFREYSVDPLERFKIKDVIAIDDMESVNEIGEISSQQNQSGIGIPTISSEETCRVAAERMAKYDLAHLIVISHHDSSKQIKITIQDLLKARLFQDQEESLRETMFPWQKR
jgi:hypothetical protein